MKKDNIRQAVFLGSMLHGQNINAWGVADIYEQYLKISRKLTRIGEDDCNGLIEEDEYQKKVNALYKKLDQFEDDYKVHYYHQTDPRGVALYISNMEMTHSNYTNGVAIY